MKSTLNQLQQLQSAAAAGDKFAQSLADMLILKPGAPVLFWNCRTEQGRRYLPDSPKVRKQYPSGRLVMRQMVDGKRQYTPVQGDPQATLVAARRTHRAVKPTGPTLATKVTQYVESLLGGAEPHPEAAENARLVLGEFMECCPVSRVRDITEKHLSTFCEVLRKKTVRGGRTTSKRTVSNKYNRVRSFLRFCKHDVTLGKNRPKFAEKPITVFERKEIDALYAHADDIDSRADCPKGYMRVVLAMGLQLGLREQELMFAEFSDVNWVERTYRVQDKPAYEFVVKDKESRDVPIRDECFDILSAWRAQRGHTSLILGIGPEGDRINGHLLRWLQSIAKRAQVEDANLHKMRRTFLTNMLRGGFDVKSIQSVAGHSDLQSTMRYLKALEAKDMVSKMNTIAL